MVASLSCLLEDEESRLLLGKQASSVLCAPVEQLPFFNRELASSDQTLKFFFVALLDSILPHRAAHSRDEVATLFERSVHIFEGGVGHVPGHPNARGRNHVVSVFQLGRELFNSSPEEKVVMLAVEATLTDGIQEVFTDIKRMQITETSALQGLANNASARAYVKADGRARDAQASLVFGLDDLVDDVVRLREIDDTGPLVVAFRREPSIPLGHVLLLG